MLICFSVILLHMYWFFLDLLSPVRFGYIYSVFFVFFQIKFLVLLLGIIYHNCFWTMAHYFDSLRSYKWFTTLCYPGFSACKAMACLNHTDLKGKRMRIMWCQRDPSLRKFGIGNLFVKNLDPSVDGTCLLGLFCQFGNVLSCKVAEENGKSKGFGFVQFDSEESAMIACTALHDTFLRGKKL